MDTTDASPNRPLSTMEQLEVLSGISTSFQSATVQADGKINMLLVLYSGITVVIASQARELHALLPTGTAEGSEAIIAVLAFACGFLACGYHLVQAFRPRVTSLSGVNRFAFPAVSHHRSAVLDGATAATLSGELSELIEVLADIAWTKNRHIRRAMVWMVEMVAVAVLCVVAVIAIALA